MTSSKIAWTKIDEAPALATFCLLPIVKACCMRAGNARLSSMSDRRCPRRSGNGDWSGATRATASLS